MKLWSKILVIFPLLLILCLPVIGQGGNAPAQDEEMDMFLLVMAGIFLSAMFGAAIIGACIGMLVLFFIFGLMALGAISTSVIFGFYKRSYTAGFKSFLIIIFGGACSMIGGFGLWLLNAFLELKISGLTLFLTGFTGGMIGGILMGLATYKLIRITITFLLKQFSIPEPSSIRRK